MNMELRELTLNDVSNYDIYTMLQEIDRVDHGFENSAFGLSFEVYGKWIKTQLDHSKGVDLPPDWVKQTTCWCYVDNRVVGYGKIRHELTDYLRIHGGHIGYALRKSERGKGYGKLWFGMLLIKARELGVGEVLMTCNPDNLVSRMVIEANGGVFFNSDEETLRFWVRKS